MPQLTTLCGIKLDQTEADLSKRRLDEGDAVLLSFDLEKNTVLTKLKCLLHACAPLPTSSYAPMWSIYTSEADVLSKSHTIN